MIEERGDWSFVQAALDGYCGWIESRFLGRDLPAITHRVSTPRRISTPKRSETARDRLAVDGGAGLGHGNAGQILAARERRLGALDASCDPCGKRSWRFGRKPDGDALSLGRKQPLGD
ncbi:hypothetical protein QWZ10_14125 [Paracoccus cavernae]|uniref:Bacterial dipeptidyl-peptidase SH3 domain-containing protein n=1 Tax=Paracoccus cavernae TaxID=1571207 RepID=A0ABT8D8E2_9RHOB|nr:hypothetical protein [Paracoccus cavernae]